MWGERWALDELYELTRAECPGVEGWALGHKEMELVYCRHS